MEVKSRYGDSWVFESVEGGFRFRLPAYTRVGFGDDPGEVYFIDPPGGPFLSIGGNLDGRKITGFEDHGDYVLIKVEEGV